MKTLLNALLSAGLILTMACNNNQPAEQKADDSMEAAENKNEEFDKTQMDDDVKFAMEAADGGMLEVKLGQLAQTNASSPKVQQLGMMMVDDHSKANEELKALAQKKNIALPLTMSKDKQDTYDRLAKKTGAEFDKEYTEEMVKDHKKDIDAFEKEASDGKDADIKSWAASKLPTLKHHLEMAENDEEMAKDEKKDKDHNNHTDHNKH